MKNSKPEKLILKVPNRLWLFGQSGPAFCMPRNRAFIGILVSMSVGFFLMIYHSYVYVPFFMTIIEATIWSSVFILFILSALPTVFIRKGCFNCQFGFHIVEHERKNLLFKTLKEILVEEETLRHTGGQLIPILLSNPKICRDCPFNWRKMYCQATLNYLKKK